LYGRAQDSFYFKFESASAFQYSFKYDILDTSLNDPEPNNQFSEATPIIKLEEKKGHIRYASNGSFDVYDYYKTALPYDGTMIIYVKATNQGGATSYLYLYGFDGRKLPGQVLNRYISNTSNVAAGQTIYDTIYIHGRATDSFYFRFESSAAYKYSFKFNVVDSSRNDIEPNNLIDEAVPVAKLEQKYGHIRYASNGGIDVADYYKTKLAYDGTV
jgi:non-canonical (house-cleaning) NTP pyrophosphatase